MKNLMLLLHNIYEYIYQYEKNPLLMLKKADLCLM